jgi:predicted acylesterase/phospholipase RssA
MNDTPAPSFSNEFGLALSGGGFRATLFHLGVVRALAEAGVLSRVTHISSVSGGSVLSAHLVLNWEAYAKSSDIFARAAKCAPSESAAAIEEASKLFEDTSKDLLALIDSDIRNRLVRRLPMNLLAISLARLLRATIGLLCGKKFRGILRTFAEKRRIAEQLERCFRVLFRDKVLRDLARPGTPHLVILSTEVATMQHAWFSRDGFSQPGFPNSVGDDILSVARSVAASAAFPALFPPVRLDGEALQFPNSNDCFVTDAGVYDNLGISGFLGEPFPSATFPVLVSDATATSEWAAKSAPNLLTNLLRSVDIMQQRAAHLQRDKVGLPQRDARRGSSASESDKPNRFILFDIAQEDLLEEPKIGHTTQKHVSYLRTDLDAFSADEKQLLVHHGFSVAWHAMKKNGHVPDGFLPRFESWRSRWPSPVRNARNENESVALLREGRKSRLRLFSLSDPSGILCILGVLAVLLILPAALLVENSRRRMAETELGIAESARVKRERLRDAQARIESFQDFRFEPKAPVSQPSLPANQPEDSFDGLTITSFEKVFDLRGWIPVPADLRQVKALEPALQQTVYSLRRTPNAMSATFRHKTRNGIGIMPEIPTLDADLYQETVVGDYYPKQVVAQIKLHRIPPNMEYPVIVRATYWNAFQKPVEDAGFKAYTKGDLGRMVILFPETRLPIRFTFWRIMAGSSKMEAMSTPPFHLFYKNGLYFEVEKPDVNVSYGVQFTWTDDSTGPMERVNPAFYPSLLSP